jgi:radical SAM superfamily enzyme YgiQ (UPF0313 family)
MKTILLVNCPCWGVDNPPLGLATLAGYLGSRSVEVNVLDLNIEIFRRVSPTVRELWNPDRAPSWWLEEAFRSEVLAALTAEVAWAAERVDSQPEEVVGFSVAVSNRLFTREVVALLRRRSNRTIVLGGRGVYDPLEREAFLPGSVDLYYVGEGEVSLHRYLSGEQEPEGFIRRPDASVAPVQLLDLGQLPITTYEGFDLTAYRRRSLCLQLSRGCALRCAFCNDWRYTGKSRARSGRAVFEEIDHHFYENGICDFVFNDQAMNHFVEELDALCGHLASAPYAVDWTALAIPGPTMSAERLGRMREAGCSTLSYGVESGSERVLRLMRKRLVIAEVERVLRDTHRAGIQTQLNFIVGFPGETEEDFAETLRFIERNREHITGVANANTCDAIIGSDLHLHPERYGVRFPERGEAKYRYWETGSGDNTPAIRQARLDRLLDLIRASGLQIWTSNTG